jgi:serine/threonine protein kinase
MISSERYCPSCGAANEAEAQTCFACGLSLKITRPLPEHAEDRPLLQDRYRILAQVGKGGFSAVYRAQDTRFKDHLVAIKAISLSGLSATEIIEATDAFNREVVLLTHLRHPGLPRVYSQFSDAECWYMVMDFIEGVTLERHLETMPRGRLSVNETLDIGQSLCGVLEYLHSRQPPIIFRDLKPGNIIVRPDGHLSLIDFGIARHYKAGQAKDTIPFGSPGYAAPEQYGRAQTTPRSDIYSLGTILHQLLTGDDPSQTPFRFAPLHESLDDQFLLAELDALIQEMVTMDAGRRPQNITVVRLRLERIAQERLRQQKQGLRARTLSPGQVYAPIYRQPPAPPYFAPGSAGQGQIMIQRSSGIGMPPAVGSRGRRSMIVQRSTGNRSGGRPYGSAPSMPKPGKSLAIASLVISLLSLLTFFVFCSSTFAIISWSWQGSPGFPLPIIPLALIMATPSMTGVILGLLARARSTWHDVSDLAAAGIAIGSIVSIIYAGIIGIIILFWLSR